VGNPFGSRLRRETLPQRCLTAALDSPQARRGQKIRVLKLNARYKFLIDNFGLQLVLDDQFFWEWQDNLPESTNLDKQLLDKVKAGYFNFINYPLLLEGIVRMAIVAPILFIGDFYLTPFYVKSE
jgi:hypothetical protein